MTTVELKTAKVIFKADHLEIHQTEDGHVIFDRRANREQLWADETTRTLVQALLHQLELTETQRVKLLNEVAYRKQETSTAWGRHEMACRIGNATADELVKTKDRVRALEAELAALKASLSAA